MLAQSVPPSSAMISPGFDCDDCVLYLELSPISDPEGASIWQCGRIWLPFASKHRTSMTMQLPPVPAMGVQVVPLSTGVPPDQVLVLVAGRRVVLNTVGFQSWKLTAIEAVAASPKSVPGGNVYVLLGMTVP